MHALLRSHHQLRLNPDFFFHWIVGFLFTFTLFFNYFPTHGELTLAFLSRLTNLPLICSWSLPASEFLRQKGKGRFILILMELWPSDHKQWYHVTTYRHWVDNLHSITWLFIFFENESYNVRVNAFKYVWMYVIYLANYHHAGQRCWSGWLKDSLFITNHKNSHPYSHPFCILAQY